MSALLLRGQYKVTCVLYAEASYAALQAVDIRSRDKKLYLLNVYEGAYLKAYLRCFHDLRNCGSFREMFVWEESLVAVFDCRQGFPVDRVFYKGASVDWHLRMKAAADLFRQALLMSDMPPEISCAALLSENVQMFLEEECLRVNYMVPPLGEMNQRELVFLLSDQIQKILEIRWDSPQQERAFVRELSRGGERSVVAAYGKWTAAEPGILAAYEELEGMSALKRMLTLLVLNLKDWVKLRFNKRS